jgi:hypothetical protein
VLYIDYRARHSSSLLVASLASSNLFFSEERERILRELDAKNGKEGDDDDAGSDDKKGEDEDDPSKPQALVRPLIPAQRQRRPHRKTHGKISFQELARSVGERWKNLDDERRKLYQDLAKEDMKRQKVAMEAYYAKQNIAPTEHGDGDGIAEDADSGVLIKHE